MGPRQVGKSTLLRQQYPDARLIDLLKSDEFRRYSTRPELLRQEIEAEAPGLRQADSDRRGAEGAGAPGRSTLADGEQGLNFALSGSSARKVKRGAANLLGGRALRYELRGLTAGELGGDFDLDRMLNHGYLPRMYQSNRPRRMLDAYVGDYLKEEIAAEGLVRNLPAFADFLDDAALSDCELVNVTNVARECGVSGPTAKAYFGILEDTLLGNWLPAYRRRRKRRLIGAPKFYFADVGVVNRLALRGELLPGSELYGKAFENWVFHELSAFVSYADVDARLSYWRLPSGIEVDFLLGDIEVAIEAKASARINRGHLRGLRTLADEHPDVRRRIVVSLEPRPRRTDDGIDILPATTFASRLWAGELV